MKDKTATIKQLFGYSQISDGKITMNTGTEYVFLILSPTNISVLSTEAISDRICKLTNVFESVPDIEILCIDADENLDNNRRYIDDRIKDEKKKEIRDLLKKDKHYLDEMQTKASSSRIFLIAVKVNDKTPEQTEAMITAVESVLFRNGFICRCADTTEIKRIIAGYFGSRLFGRVPQDYDGEDMLKHWLQEKTDNYLFLRKELKTRMSFYDNNRSMVQYIKDTYPVGTRVELNEMRDDPRPVPPGTRGTVIFVDDIGSIGVHWDNGQGLNLIPGVDSFRKLTEQEIAAEQKSQKEINLGM